MFVHVCATFFSIPFFVAVRISFWRIQASDCTNKSDAEQCECGFLRVWIRRVDKNDIFLSFTLFTIRVFAILCVPKRERTDVHEKSFAQHTYTHTLHTVKMCKLWERYKYKQNANKYKLNEKHISPLDVAEKKDEKIQNERTNEKKICGLSGFFYIFIYFPSPSPPRCTHVCVFVPAHKLHIPLYSLIYFSDVF